MPASPPRPLESAVPPKPRDDHAAVPKPPKDEAAADKNLGGDAA
jgi:hypothetical protein